ncbi:MAG TPA: toll/interleukin-1 receptor domain-containing protein [Blastocatellia bacterium]|nr:toll/interleukin-1 receptor domain-containing protein [Blastocatellia bacterium]
MRQVSPIAKEPVNEYTQGLHLLLPFRSRWARQLVETISGVGLSVWFDETEINLGQHLVDELEKGLRTSDAIVFLIDSDNFDRPNLFFEMGAALGMNKTIIPVVPAGFEPNKLPLPLRRIRYLVRRSPEETGKELAAAIESIHGAAA